MVAGVTVVMPVVMAARVTVTVVAVQVPSPCGPRPSQAAVVVPVAIALLLAALLAPAVKYLVSRGMPRGAATAIVLIAGLVGLGAVLTFVVITFIGGLPALTAQLGVSIDATTGWLTRGPLHLSASQLEGLRTGLLTSLNANQANVTAQALSTIGTIGQTLTEVLLALFTLIFFLYDGAGIWTFLTKAVPSHIRARVDVAGRRSLAALVSYVRATAAVAVVDAAAIGLGLAILGVPLAVPLAALVFLGAFIPIIGAVVACGVAVLIALVAHGPIQALVLLGIVVGVMQLEATSYNHYCSGVRSNSIHSRSSSPSPPAYSPPASPEP